MKLLKQFSSAWRWWRLGVTPKKAWALARHDARKHDSRPELVLLALLAIAYAIVGYNDRVLAEEQAAKIQAVHNKFEAQIIECLNGKALSLDTKTWVNCYTTTIM